MAPSGIFYAAAAATLLASSGMVSGASVPCSGECAGKWQQCGGQGAPAKECCDEGFFCYELAEPSVDYMQCRAPFSVDSGWTGPDDCESVNVMCTGDEGAHPIEVEIGSHFTIATTTTDNPDSAGCEVVNGMAPPLPLSGQVFASATGITRTLKCTVTKGDAMAMCQFDITLTGEPNIFFSSDAGDGAAVEGPLEFFIE